MKRSIPSFLALLVLAVSAGPLGAAGPHDQPGIPGASNCRGQTAAYLAQASKNGLADEAFHGIGGIGRWADLSVTEVQEVIRNYCGS